MKHKLNLSTLKLTSFVTELSRDENSTVNGGIYTVILITGQDISLPKTLCYPLDEPIKDNCNCDLMLILD